MRSTRPPGISPTRRVVVNHLNFNLGRINPYFTQNASVGVDLYQHEKRPLRFQADVANLDDTPVGLGHYHS